MIITHKQPTVKLQIKADAVVDTRISLDEWNSATDDERGELVAEHCAFNSDVSILTPEATADGLSANEASNPTALGAGELTRLCMALNDMHNEMQFECGKVVGKGEPMTDLTRLRAMWERLIGIGREIGL